MLEKNRCRWPTDCERTGNVLRASTSLYLSLRQTASCDSGSRIEVQCSTGCQELRLLRLELGVGQNTLGLEVGQLAQFGGDAAS